MTNHEHDPLYKLPTTEEISRRGVAEYTRLSSTKAKAIFRSPVNLTTVLDVQRCFVGVSAEISFELHDRVPEEVLAEAGQVINEQSALFFFFYKPGYSSLFNLLAVRQVVRNYPEYFSYPQLLSETRVWLQNNRRIWGDGREDNCIRYGVLSGFPLEAARTFAVSKREGKRATQHVRSEITNLSYFGFDEERDSRYMQQLDDIFLHSGIRAIA